MSLLKYNRIPEPELMEGKEQVLAYSEADFALPHSMIIQALKNQLNPRFHPDLILDLGAGSGDMTYRLFETFPTSKIYAVDGSEEMLTSNRNYFQKKNSNANIVWENYKIQDWIPESGFDLIFSNSLLHHLTDPYDFWAAIQRSTYEESFIFIADLLRPDSFEEVDHLTQKYAKEEKQILKEDFYNSLCAAYTLEELQTMLSKLRLNGKLHLEVISDRHWICYSRLSS
ncbi:SAM-dependent methyltransferase [Leptospira kobayashii]|uniref:SAM-dependent methyltransferase n=1 Tax=Leptospira kobayashii TaxID=1917830 RepID=A0ABM7UN53_9LEPT|nr:class I SAM-dependent methyltransferase [Leptospira kobayashii]BDA80527.1 SAM-dependent methyltransferase [Leptospira kobayashii]